MLHQTASFLKVSSVRYVGNLDASVSKIALACGSGGSFLDAARRKGCDCMLTGEATFHACLEAQATGIGLILVGHYASERFAMQWLADHLSSEMSELVVWASCDEEDPIERLSV
ncbi:MAG: Nif3-like dinuclear metal center hexameric protein [Pirellulaceae bacterium]